MSLLSTSSALNRIIRQQHWLRCANTHSEIRVATVKAFLTQQGFDLSHPDFVWQNKFLRRWFIAPWAQSQVWWKDVLESVEQLSEGRRASGRTTMLALLLAVENCLPEKRKALRGNFPDHYGTFFTAHLLEGEARRLQNAWRDYLGGSTKCGS